MMSIFKLGFVVSFITAIGCGKAASPAPACPARYKEVPADQQKGDLTCSCTASATGTVWGAGIYTTDSSICSAAKHAGVAVPGDVTVRAAAGCSAYNGSTANGG